ncbi:uncharacterized protein MELLADRAFT_71388 [Melampsora larici-populina 98AG31]|uniref:Uncharacterized protein n=1 Tax=Melampsora larici-populina (strain 98AG31 / pathotype 3-4-7) TaxID=747676 RepID=F4RG93_MELLP|nr:uncharacterized protein MELLADRAFT_71388 [Melampsora larici-populina 98AG31]EGG08708.1 hypothetical protein MELLADRAFT_71388 [Melampsora larici-populina 98AG31]
MPPKPKTTETFRSFENCEALNAEDISNHLEPASKKKYECGTKKFAQFCKDHNRPLDPNEENLAHVITVTARKIKPGTVKKYLTGISYVYRKQFPMVDIARSSEQIKSTVRGVKKMFSVATKQAPAFTLINMHLAYQSFDSSFNDLLFRAILGLGFFGLHHLGKLVVPDQILLRNPRK